jgi:hypothetical protein
MTGQSEPLVRDINQQPKGKKEQSQKGIYVVVLEYKMHGLGVEPLAQFMNGNSRRFLSIWSTLRWTDSKLQ